MGQKKVNRTLNWKKTKYYQDTLAHCQEVRKERIAKSTKVDKTDGDTDGKKT